MFDAISKYILNYLFTGFTTLVLLSLALPLKKLIIRLDLSIEIPHILS